MRTTTRMAVAAMMAAAAAAACDGSDPTDVPAPSVATVEVTPATAALAVGDTIRLTARALTADGQVLGGFPVSWVSERTALASVSSPGVTVLVTATGAGTATIAATVQGRTGRATLTIADTAGSEPPPPTPGPVATVVIDADSLTLEEGEVAQLSATARDAQGNVVTGRFVAWTSGDAGVAPVAALGAVTGVRAGGTTITARVDGVEASIPVRVTADYPYELVFVGWEGFEPYQPRIYGLDLGDTTRAHVRMGPDAPVGDPAPSPDGTRIAYARDLGNGVHGLYVSNMDGTGTVELHVSADTRCGDLDWSPDGARLAFTCPIGDADLDIWVVNADGGGLVNLTDGYPGHQEGPSWSPRRPDGSYRIAYAQYVDGEPQIWTMKDDGTDAKRVSTGMDWQPAWSPDGATIAFVRAGAAIFGDIWLVDADGGNERGLVGGHLAGPQWSPAWSPDGRLVAFASTHETYGSGETLVSQIYTVWADGSRLARRTTGALDKHLPAWRGR